MCSWGVAPLRIYQLCKSNATINPFNHFIDYLHEKNALNKEELEIFGGIGREFINVLETTGMSKSYKMPLLLAFYNNGNIKMRITEDDVYHSFYEFYYKGTNRIDMLKDKSTENFEKWDKKHYLQLAKSNPVHYIKESSKGYFVDEPGYVLALNSQLENVIDKEEFKKHMKDVIDYESWIILKQGIPRNRNQFNQLNKQRIKGRIHYGVI